MSVQTTWDADYLNVYYAGFACAKTHQLVNQDQIWVTARGDVVYIEEMDSNHLLNTILFLERVARDIYATVEDEAWLGAVPEEYDLATAQQWLVDTPVYAGLKDEVLRRMTSEYIPQADEDNETLSPPHDHEGMPDPTTPFYRDDYDYGAEQQTGNDDAPEPEFGEVRLG